LGQDFAAYTSAEPSERVIASLISKNTESELISNKAMQTAAEAKVKLDSLKAAVKNSTASADLLKPINESIAQAEKKLKEADEAVFKAQESVKPSEALSSQISSAYHKLQVGAENSSF
jgi:hypothetical protein